MRMKKLTVLLLSLIAFFSVAFATPRLFVYADEAVEVEPYMPSSALELYALEAPTSISYSDSGYAVITEHRLDKEDPNVSYDRISVYNPNDKKFTALPAHNTIYNVTHAEVHGNFLFYLSGSFIYYVPLSDLTAQPRSTGVNTANFFKFKDNFVITNTSNSINVYSVETNGTAPLFTLATSRNFTTKIAILSEEDDVYYVSAGKLYRFGMRTNLSSSLVVNLDFDVNYMTDYKDYVYFTASTGLYRVKKSADTEIETVVEALSEATSLGSFKNPQGLAVKDGEILVADPDLQCIQGIIPETKEFSTFAITTESTADYRLTNSASKLSLSENYLYVLDNSASLGDGINRKRIARIAINSNENKYSSINLSSFYEENPEFEIKLFACSDTHVAIYDGKKLSVYQYEDFSIKYSVESETITTLSYLDGDFYYTDGALSSNLTDKIINVYKLSTPTETNELETITSTKLSEGKEIKGVAVYATVDVFSNVYLIYKENDESTELKMVRFYNGSTGITANVNHTVISVKCDFAGNVYMLSDNGAIYKYSYKEAIHDYEVTPYTVASSGMQIKDIELNYRSNVCYMLSSACVLKTTADQLQISNLSGVPADEINLLNIVSEPKFITVNKDAKLFKVTPGDYLNVEGKNYFKTITPISNPNVSRVYLVIAEISDDYYLVSYNSKLTALARKTSVNTDPTFIGDATVISTTLYGEFGIDVSTLDGKQKLISNDTYTYAKPIFDNNYKLIEIKKGTAVYPIKKVTFNDTEMTLISLSENGEPCGYVVSGYVTDLTFTPSTTESETVKIVSGDNGKHFNDVLMILIIAFTITAAALIIEKKLLFDKEDGNLN